MVGILIAYSVTVTGVSVGQCVPLQSLWDTTIEDPHCINYGSFTLATGIINILTDFTILFLPIPLIWNLQTSAQKKWLLIFTFAMGSR